MIEGLSKVLTMTGEAHNVTPMTLLSAWLLPGRTQFNALSLTATISVTVRMPKHQDLLTLSAINKELRGRIVLVRHHYVELATKIIAQLEQFDRATRDALLDKNPASTPQSDDAELLALANRLKPNT